MRKIILTITALIGFAAHMQAQELNARVTVNADRIGNNVNKNMFQTLQKSLTNFINNRKWTTVAFKPNEKIDCNFLLNVSPTNDANVYEATLTIQSARPVFSSAYNSPIVNFRDDDIRFKYVEFQQIDFNENRVSGTDPLEANLPAVFAYYAYIILGMDFDSYAGNGGAPYFTKALNIVNNAPDIRNIIKGWKPFDGKRNRYWLAENLTNSRYVIFHQFYYNYYRTGFDQLSTDINQARLAMLDVLDKMIQFEIENPNTMIQQFFFQGKSDELTQLFAKADPVVRSRAKEKLTKVDITNLNKYNDGLR